MTGIRQHPLAPAEAALWWLGQAGYIVRAGALTVAIDPYLSDSVGQALPDFTRLYPPPFPPAELHADVICVTHDHLDHLDPETIRDCPVKTTAWFVAPRLVARRLPDLGVPADRIVRLEAGESWTTSGLEIRGVFALPTGADVLDTTGYLLRFANGRSVYHTSDTVFHPLVLEAAPRSPDVMLVPINGKWGNPSPDTAALFAAAVQPRFVLPNHYDLMALNAENPETFRWFCGRQGMGDRCVLPARMRPFTWN